MENLEITEGEDITHPLYLFSDVLKKQPIRGAYTIENEDEIFIDKPVSEKRSERELVNRLKELKGLRKKVKKLEEELEEERRENRELQEINKKFRVLPLLTRKNTNKLFHRLFKAEGKIYKLEKELDKEKN